MHLGSWESTPEAREELGFASCHSNASCVLFQLLRATIDALDRRARSKDHFLEGTVLLNLNFHMQ